MSQPLLTIVVPTYNRAHCLRTVLGALTAELAGLDGRVAIVLGDNASSDDTPTQTAAFAKDWHDTTVLRHESNLGPDENFCRCVEQVRSPYFWIIGDDDLPRAGVVAALLTLLERSSPDLVYMNSHWSETLPDRAVHGRLSAPLNAVRISRLTFARRVHVWTTFISGCVVRRSLAPDASLRRFASTNLVQLGWVLEALRQGERFLHVQDRSVYATSGNTGGYSVLKVFGQNFQRISREIFATDSASRRVGEAIIHRTTIAFMPDLVWGFRNARLGDFDPNESVATAVTPEVRRTWTYRFLILPIERLPDWPARLLLKLAHCLARAYGIFDLMRARLSGAIERL
jgi:abequosyltransferase